MAQRAQSFTKNAAIYRDCRPAYPQEVYTEIQRHACLNENAHILEIGAAHGVATAQMLQNWNAHITALEPGEELCAMAREQFSRHPTVTFIQSTFEEYATEEKFDCICAATSFHWVDPAFRYTKTAKLLRDNGILALFWNNYSRNDEPIFDAIQDIYAAYHPDGVLDEDIRGIQQRKIAERKQELEATEEFETVAHHEYEHYAAYTAERYIKLLQTFSPNAIKPQQELATFYTKIRECLLDDGDKLRLPIRVSLEIGRKLPSPP